VPTESPAGRRARYKRSRDRAMARVRAALTEDAHFDAIRDHLDARRSYLDAERLAEENVRLAGEVVALKAENVAGRRERALLRAALPGRHDVRARDLARSGLRTR
jgi:hypothetical protein